MCRSSLVRACGVTLGFMLCLIAGPICAQIVSTTGVTLIASPASEKQDVLESDTSTLGWTEKTGFVLPVDVTAEITAPGTYDGINPFTMGTVAHGTVVNSYYFHADPFDPNSGVSYSGSITFATPILATIACISCDVACQVETLDASTPTLGASGTIYQTKSCHGYEYGTPDTLTLSPDRRTVTFSNSASGAMDDFRVVTKPVVTGSPALGPPGLVVLTLLLLIAAGRSRALRHPGASRVR